MATPYGILAWRIPWTEDPGRLQSMGSESDLTEATEHVHMQAHWLFLKDKIPFNENHK